MTKPTDPSGSAPTDRAESVLARLRNLSPRYPNVPRSSMLLLYAQQGLLARLQASPHGRHFVLKGALSLFVRYGDAARPTEDVDLAARDLPNTPEALERVLQAVCAVPYADGLTFDPDSVRVRVINEALEYQGVNAALTASLGPSQVTVPLDVSFGNAITPAPVALAFPALLVPEGVPVMAYPLETVLSEKFAALVEIGLNTTRMKDAYDLHVILGREPFEAAVLGLALTRSFAARGTPVEDVPFTLSPEFANDETLAERWAQYRRRTHLSAPGFPEVMAQVRALFAPILLENRATGAWDPQARGWS
ncbi:MAG TPA: nucleotidyl transferase AbiEii/AbiGii toxin family protein [Deinococcales bacterium]|nr:nucleotidyl transferase AbiEii/AbiGii toxin family protein [Deinococcales bacterium]